MTLCAGPPRPKASRAGQTGAHSPAPTALPAPWPPQVFLPNLFPDSYPPSPPFPFFCQMLEALEARFFDHSQEFCSAASLAQVQHCRHRFFLSAHFRLSQTCNILCFLEHFCQAIQSVAPPPPSLKTRVGASGCGRWGRD